MELAGILLQIQKMIQQTKLEIAKNYRTLLKQMEQCLFLAQYRHKQSNLIYAKSTKSNPITIHNRQRNNIMNST